MTATELLEEEELNRLERFLTRPGPRFGLALAVARDARVENEARQSLFRRLRSRMRIGTVVLGPEDAQRDLVARLADAAEDAPAVFVVGFERLLLRDDARPHRSPSVANLNQSRDLLPERAPARFVFWLGEAGEAEILEQAFDLHQVFLTEARFDRVAPASQTREPGHDFATKPYRSRRVNPDEAVRISAVARRLEKSAEIATSDRSQAELELSASTHLVSIGSFAEALECAERAAKKFHSSGDAESRAEALLVASRCLHELGRTDEAQALETSAFDPSSSIPSLG